MENFKWKVYTNDKTKLEYLAGVFNLSLEYLKGNTLRGYVSNGKYLRVFSKGSYVDLCEDIPVLGEWGEELWK